MILGADGNPEQLETAATSVREITLMIPKPLMEAFEAAYTYVRESPLVNPKPPSLQDFLTAMIHNGVAVAMQALAQLEEQRRPVVIAGAVPPEWAKNANQQLNALKSGEGFLTR